LAAKIELADNGRMEDACAAINRVEVVVRRQHPQIRFSFVEPDISD